MLNSINPWRLTAMAFFDMRADEYLIPDAKTKYAYFCFTREDLIAKGVPDLPNGIHVIGVEPIITPGHEHNVHHAVLSASSYQDTCGDVPFPTFIYGKCFFADGSRKRREKKIDSQRFPVFSPSACMQDSLWAHSRGPFRSSWDIHLLGEETTKRTLLRCTITIPVSSAVLVAHNQ